ncbi:CPBP family intramembrane glutamic endopeptidase [Prosthecochloris ethylica]|nr:CPBP family intramembrane glutamic endopeptidase [Prosthecochloris ethylica]
MIRGYNSKIRLLFFWLPSLVVILLFIVYPLAGALMLEAVAPGQTAAGGLMTDELLVPVRLVQVVGQVLVLGLPVFVLVRFQTASRHPFSSSVLRFLGLGSRFPWRIALLALAVVVTVQPLLFTLMQGIEAVLRETGPEGVRLLERQERLEAFLSWMTVWGSPLEFLGVLTVIAVVPACCEELLFRGFLQGSYKVTLLPVVAVVLVGAVFALFHMSPVNLLPLVLMGCLLGFLYEWSGHLGVPVLVHFSNNALSLLMLELQRTMPEAAEKAGNDLAGEPWWWGVSLGAAGLLWYLLLQIRRLGVSRSAAECDVMMRSSVAGR